MRTASETGQIAVTALKAGFRGLDCATMYETSRFVGSSFKEYLTSAGERQDVFVSLKAGQPMMAPQDTDFADLLKMSLRDLQLEYVDLYMVRSRRPLCSSYRFTLHLSQWT